MAKQVLTEGCSTIQLNNNREGEDGALSVPIRGKPVRTATYESPVGALRLFATDKGLCGLAFNKGADKNTLAFECDKRDGSFNHSTADDHLAQAVVQLDEYFAGERTDFDLTLDVISGTTFQRTVWEALRAIPYGQTRSYGQIAQTVGRPKASRAVGGANNKNPIAIIIPCHRVIGASGKLVGFGGGLNVKEQLIELERN